MSERMPTGPPPLARQAREALWPIEAAAFAIVQPLLRTIARGAQHPVLVLPGFAADDRSTAPLRWALRGHGHWVHGWRLGRNMGPTERAVTGMRNRIEQLHREARAPDQVVGWSLGGIYARQLARERRADPPGHHAR